MHSDHSNAGWGFSAALVTPAIFSTIKQAEREASREIHALADIYTTRNRRRQPAPLTAGEAAVLRRFGIILAQQVTNGACFLIAARVAVMAGGVWGGVVAQIAITLNTMFHPGQTQRFNPSRLLSRASEMNWVDALSPSQQLFLACLLGQAAASFGYGRSLPEARWRELSSDRVASV